MVLKAYKRIKLCVYIFPGLIYDDTNIVVETDSTFGGQAGRTE